MPGTSPGNEMETVMKPKFIEQEWEDTGWKIESIRMLPNIKIPCARCGTERPMGVMWVVESTGWFCHPSCREARKSNARH